MEKEEALELSYFEAKSTVLSELKNHHSDEAKTEFFLDLSNKIAQRNRDRILNKVRNTLYATFLTGFIAGAFVCLGIIALLVI